MLLALRDPVASPVENDSVTISFKTGPNVVPYDYVVSCYAQNDAIPTTDCGAVRDAGLTPLGSTQGTLPVVYSVVNAQVDLPGNPDVDCLVSIGGGPFDVATMCQYAVGESPGPPALPTTAFVVESDEGGQVIACTIDYSSSPSSLTGCTATDATGLDEPYVIAITGSTAFVTEYGAGEVTACTIDDSSSPSSLTGCTATDATGLDGPDVIAITGSTAFVSQTDAGEVTACTIDDSSSPSSLTGCTATDAYCLAEPYVIAITGSTAFVSEFDGDQVTACTIDDSSSPSSLTGCTVPVTGLDGPDGIAIIGSTAFVVEYDGGQVTACTIDDSSSPSSLTGCTATDATGLSNPTAIALS